MNTEVVKKEIQELFDQMGLGNDIESITVHQGATNRFSVCVGEGHGERYAYRDQYNDEEASDTPEGDFVRMLIGERGNNLNAIEHLLKRIIKKRHGDEYKFTLDINEYRMKQLEDLKQDIKTAAHEVRLYKKEVPLRCMSSFERRIVHLLLAEYPDITTESIGEEPERRVVIKPYP